MYIKRTSAHGQTSFLTYSHIGGGLGRGIRARILRNGGGLLVTPLAYRQKISPRHQRQHRQRASGEPPLHRAERPRRADVEATQRGQIDHIFRRCARSWSHRYSASASEDCLVLLVEKMVEL